MSTLATSVVTFAKNLMPMVTSILTVAADNAVDHRTSTGAKVGIIKWIGVSFTDTDPGCC